MGSAPSQPLNLGTEGLPAGRWVPRYGPGHSHPGGNGESLEEHRLNLAAERDPDAGEPLLRDSTWTSGQQRSSVWSGSYEAPRCLSTFASGSVLFLQWFVRSPRRGMPAPERLRRVDRL